MDGVDIFEFPGSRVPYLPDYRNGCTPRHRRIPSRASENVDSISPSLFGPPFSHAFPGPLHYFPLSIQPFLSPLQKKERKEKAAVGICIKSFHFGGHVTVLEFFWVEMSSPSKRRDMDVMKLMMSDHAVETINDGINEFNVEFHGPKESLYEGGVWKVRVELPDAYPYKSPSIGFLNKIFHPNVDELSGSVCLDVINQSWSPMFDLLNVFEVFLPQLLLYPNPTDPLNGDAASLMMRDQQQYEQKVKEYCERYAKRVNTANSPAEDSSDDDDISDCQSTGFSDDDVAGHADP